MVKISLFAALILTILVACASPASPVSPSGNETGAISQAKQTQQISREEWQNVF